MNDLLITILKLFLAIIFGGIIGIERETMGKPAGSRTYALVALGSTLFTLLSLDGFGQGANVDPSRIAGQIIVGIGFIGAGLIIFHKQHIEGITTAAALWVTAAVGMAIGVGWYLISTITTAFILLLLYIVRKIEFSSTKKGTLWDLLDRKSKKKWWV
jgi:putative Mg2+ transporter-C (MgtC) family protein